MIDVGSITLSLANVSLLHFLASLSHVDSLVCTTLTESLVEAPESSSILTANLVNELGFMYHGPTPSQSVLPSGL